MDDLDFDMDSFSNCIELEGQDCYSNIGLSGSGGDGGSFASASINQFYQISSELGTMPEIFTPLALALGFALIISRKG